MKKIFLLFSFCYYYPLIFAQTITEIDSMDVSFEDQILNVFQNVDLSEIENSNGILYDHGFPFLNIGPFNGIITDSSLSSMPLFSMAYATIFGMVLDVQYRLPVPSAYRTFCDTVKSTSVVIPLAVLHQEYYQISPTAIEDNLMTISGSQIYDVAGRAFSPYVQKELFMVSPARADVKGGLLQLRFDENLFFANHHKIPSNKNKTTI